MNNLEGIHPYEFDIKNRFLPYIGKSTEDIIEALGLRTKNLTAKQSIYQLVKYVIEEDNYMKEFLDPIKLDDYYQVKTIRLEPNGKPEQSMSFEVIDFTAMTDEEWGNSTLRNKFLNTNFLLVVFQYDQRKKDNPNRQLFFKGMKPWKIPIDVLDREIKDVWTRTRQLALEGIEIEEVKSGNKTIRKNNLPGMSFNGVAHVRPKAKNASDTTMLPSGQSITKQSFWLNASYITSIVSDLSNAEYTKKFNRISSLGLDDSTIDLLRGSLGGTIHTVNSFKKELNDTGIPHLSDGLLNSLGYRSDGQYVFSQDYENVQSYFDEKIFSRDYFVLEEKDIYKTASFKNYLKRLQKNLSLIEIEPDIFITKISLKRAGITESDLKDYVSKTLAYFKDDNRYMSLRSLKRQGFEHALEDYGFESHFFENVIMQSESHSYIEVFGQKLFAKNSADASDMDWLESMMNQNNTRLIELMEAIELELGCDIDEKELLRYLRKGSSQKRFYYAQELEKVFPSQQKYYEHLYSSGN